MHNPNREDVIFLVVLHITIQLQKHKPDSVGVYAPNISKPKDKSVQFYDELQIVLDKLPKENKIILGFQCKDRVQSDRLSRKALLWRENQCQRKNIERHITNKNIHPTQILDVRSCAKINHQSMKKNTTSNQRYLGEPKNSIKPG